MQRVFADMVLSEGLLEQLGPAMHSGRPIFVYGPAGAGKTYVASRLANLFDDSILLVLGQERHLVAGGDHMSLVGAKRAEHAAGGA